MPHVKLAGLPMGAYGAPRGLAGAHGAPRGLAGAHGDPQNQEIAALWVFWRTLVATCSPLCPRNSRTGTQMCPRVPACARVCPRVPTGAHGGPHRALRGNRRPGLKRQDHPGSPPPPGATAVGWPVCPMGSCQGYLWVPTGPHGGLRVRTGPHGAPRNQEIAALRAFLPTLAATCSPLCPRNSRTGTHGCS
jgi:hypothetical protein